MALQYVLYKNHLATSEDPYFVHSQCSGIVEWDDLLDVMAKGRTTLSKPDITGCMQLFVEELQKLLADGRNVKTPFGTFYVRARGTMGDETTPFTPGSATGNHSLRIGWRPDQDFERAILAGVTLKRLESFDRTMPVLHRANSVRDDGVNAALPGDFLRISGLRLKFDPANTNEGVFFVNGTETRAVQYAEIKPKTLIVEVPKDLHAGEYALAVRSMEGGKTLKEGILPANLVVS